MTINSRPSVWWKKMKKKRRKTKLWRRKNRQWRNSLTQYTLITSPILRHSSMPTVALTLTHNDHMTMSQQLNRLSGGKNNFHSADMIQTICVSSFLYFLFSHDLIFSFTDTSLVRPKAEHNNKRVMWVSSSFSENQLKKFEIQFLVLCLLHWKSCLDFRSTCFLFWEIRLEIILSAK